MKRQKNGLYRAKIKVGVDADGRDVYKYLSARTQKELEQRKRDARAYYIDGVGTVDDELFGSYAQRWFDAKSKKVVVKTAENYRNALNVHILPVFGDRRMRAIRPTEIEALLNSIDGTTKTVTSVLKMIFRNAEKDDVIIKNPMHSAEIPTVNIKAERRGLTDAERAALVASFDPTNNISLMTILGYYLGLRIGEILGLSWGDIDWNAHVVHIHNNFNDHDGDHQTKTAAGVRDVPLPTALEDILHPMRQHPSSTVVRRSGRKNFYASCVMRTADRLRTVTGIEKISMHWLRHNYVCQCWESHVDVYATAKFVGHRDIKTTLEIYNHLSEKTRINSAQIVREMF